MQENKKSTRKSENQLLGGDNGDTHYRDSLMQGVTNEQNKDTHKARVLSAIHDYHHRNKDNAPQRKYRASRGM
jgi:hypothetical protein